MSCFFPLNFSCVDPRQEGLEVEEEFARCFSDTGSAGSGFLAEFGSGPLLERGGLQKAKVFNV